MIVILHGLPGVGKLTVAQQLAKLSGGWKLFHNHLVVDAVSSLFDFGTPGFIESRDIVWTTMFRLGIQEDIDFIFTFAFETSADEAFQKIATMIQESHVPVLYFELTCDLEELTKRLASPSRESFGKLTNAKLLRSLLSEGVLYSGSDEELVTNCLTIDTTHQSPQASAARIWEEVQKAREKFSEETD